MPNKKKIQKSLEVRVEQSALHHDLFSGKYRAMKHRSAKDYKRKVKHKGRSETSSYDLFCKLKV